MELSGKAQCVWGCKRWGVQQGRREDEGVGKGLGWAKEGGGRECCKTGWNFLHPKPGMPMPAPVFLFAVQYA